MSTTFLDPRVIDASTLTPKASSDIYLPVGIEGQADTAGTAAVGTLMRIARVDEAVTAFGAIPASPLTRITKAVLDRGAGPVVAVASAKGATLPTLVQRQAQWQKLSSDTHVRLRLSDTEIQAELNALATSVGEADLLYNKQVAFGGLATGQTKAQLTSAAGALATAGGLAGATRFVFVGPGVYDETGTLRGGSFAAACVAAEVAKNSDPGNDLDLWTMPLLGGIELGPDGRPVFQRQVVSGVAVNDYEDLLQGGVSVLQPSRVPGGVQTTHLRTVYIASTTYDNLYTRIIVDQVFVDVRDYILDKNFLRVGNTSRVREQIKSGVAAMLEARSTWISPVAQVDGTLGYNVSVTSSADNRQVTVGYEGIVVRGISTVRVAANLSIPA